MENSAEGHSDGDQAPGGPARASYRARTEVEAFMVGVPVKFAATYRRTMEGAPGLRNAVNSKCRECVNFEDTVNRVRNCTAKRCALWSYRPYQTGDA